MAAAVESGEIMDGYVTESNSGGLVALVKNVRVFGAALAGHAAPQ